MTSRGEPSAAPAALGDLEEIEALRRGLRRRKNKYLLISVLTMAIFLCIWELCSDGLRLLPAYSLPSPIAAVRAFITKFYDRSPDRGYIWQHALASLKVVVVGGGLGVLVGIPLGVLMGWYKKFDQCFKTVFDVIRPIPPIAWIPIMVVLLGIGIRAKAAVIFLASVVPCVINTYSGIKQVNPVHLWVAQISGASDLQMLRTIGIPSALPMIFTGVRVALNAAWMALVAAELLASTQGLGYMIQISRTFGRPDIIIAGMFAIGILSMLFNLGIGLLEKKFVKGGM